MNNSDRIGQKLGSQNEKGLFREMKIKRSVLLEHCARAARQVALPVSTMTIVIDDEEEGFEWGAEIEKDEDLW